MGVIANWLQPFITTVLNTALALGVGVTVLRPALQPITLATLERIGSLALHVGFAGCLGLG
ncbi:MAG: hypothetical protein H7240_08775 [Glaciimonas sp.]|nr:hypothetical protein [Glaciimonas sp.]